MSDPLHDRDRAENRASSEPRRTKTAEEAGLELYGPTELSRGADGGVAKKAAAAEVMRLREILARRQR